LIEAIRITYTEYKFIAIKGRILNFSLPTTSISFSPLNGFSTLKQAFVAAALTLLTACDQSNDVSEANKNSDLAKKSATHSTPQISVKEKKANFFNFLSPLIQKANADVLKQREKLLSIQQSLSNLNSQQADTLAALAKTYKVSDELPPEVQVKALDKKINTIPASLVLAQAANESAWGTSRFAQEGNNYFGQWCFSKGCGIVPNSRNSGANHEVADFDTPLDSVKSYIKNLNRHASYKTLREIRQEAIDNNQPVTGVALAEGLIGYSERREEYVEEIQNMIRYNKLSRFNTLESSK
jgi:Bax protein|tara:strand:- start:623 stop:1513 length:891 start_codon:yes stop_codon:yes gene_type:complete